VVKVYSWAVAWVLAAMTRAADRRPIEREGLRSFISVREAIGLGSVDCLRVFIVGYHG
jgi:hypothetical protein